MEKNNVLHGFEGITVISENQTGSNGNITSLNNAAKSPQKVEITEVQIRVKDKSGNIVYHDSIILRGHNLPNEQIEEARQLLRSRYDVYSALEAVKKANANAIDKLIVA